MKYIYAAILSCVYQLAFALTDTEDLIQKLNAIHALKANFSQKVTSHHRTISSASGKVLMQRPGRFRWETLKPNQQLVLADGKRVWIYDVELEQVTSKPQASSLRGTPALFLTTSNETLARDFTVQRTVKGTDERYQLHAKASKSPFSQVELLFSHHELVALALDDQLSQHTQVTLNHVQTNPTLSAKLFQFKPPQGVDVMHE